MGPLVLLIQAPDGLHAFETTADFVDLGVDVLGRADVALADLPTPVTFDVDGLEPVASPSVLFASSNAGVAISTAVPGPVDWSASGRPLVDATRGDVAWLVQPVVAADPTIPATVTASRRCMPAPITDLAMVNGAPATVDATLGPCPEIGSVAADWRIPSSRPTSRRSTPTPRSPARGSSSSPDRTRPPSPPASARAASRGSTGSRCFRWSRRPVPESW